MSGPGEGRWGARLPWGFVAMLATVAGVECSLARRPELIRNLVAEDAHLSWRAAAEGVRGRDVLVFGDSMVKFGVQPRVLEAGTGLKVAHLGVLSGQAPASYYLLRRALEAGARPSVVVVDFFPQLLLFGARGGMEHWTEMLGPLDCVELARTDRDADLLARVAVGRALPSARGREMIRKGIAAAFRGERGPVTAERLKQRRNLAANGGAYVMPGAPGAKYDLGRWVGLLFHSSRFSKTNVIYMHKFIDLAASRGIPVVLILPPINPALQAETVRTGFDAEYERFLRKVAARFPNLTVVDGRRAGYDPDVFSDPNHLGREGALIYSDELAGVLRGLVRGPGPSARWVDLPPYRPRPVPVSLEDYYQSAVALDQDAAPRRR